MKTLSYLDNLIARTTLKTAVIQPRPLSLFEPWPGTALALPAPLIGEEGEVIAPAEPPIGPTPQPQPLPRVAATAGTAVPPPIALPGTVQPVLAEAAPQLVTTSLPTVASRAAKPRKVDAVTPDGPPPAPLVQPALPPLPAESVQRPQRRLPTDDPPATFKPPRPPQPGLVYAAPAPPSERERKTTAVIREQVTLIKSVTEAPAKTAPTLVEIVHQQAIQPLPTATRQPSVAVAHEQPGKRTMPSTASKPAQIEPFASGTDQPASQPPPVTPPPESTPFASPAAIRPAQIKPFTPVTDQPASQPPVTLPQSAPSVQITIGRIEVRAALPAPAKAENKQTRTPVLGLDEYLRQRSGGRP